MEVYVFGGLLSMKPNEITTIREQVLDALARITVDTPVKIPPGRQALCCVYEHGRKTARRYRIRKGIVYLVPNKITYKPGYFSDLLGTNQKDK